MFGIYKFNVNISLEIVNRMFGIYFSTDVIATTFLMCNISYSFEYHFSCVISVTRLNIISHV